MTDELKAAWTETCERLAAELHSAEPAVVRDFVPPESWTEAINRLVDEARWIDDGGTSHD